MMRLGCEAGLLVEKGVQVHQYRTTYVQVLWSGESPPMRGVSGMCT